MISANKYDKWNMKIRYELSLRNCYLRYLLYSYNFTMLVHSPALEVVTLNSNRFRDDLLIVRAMLEKERSKYVFIET